jgi:hypothetical protein
MKRSLLMILSIAVILVIAMPAMTYGQGKANFAGTWVRNAEKSDQPQGGGGGGGFGGGPMTVKQEANLITVETTRTGQDGQTTTSTMKYTLDGKESINTSARGDSKSVVTWSADGKSLTIVTTRNMNGNDFTTKAVWTLEGANLVVNTTMPNQDGGTTNRKVVYDKK